MARKASDSGARIVVVTGGEPVMYDLTALTEALKSFRLQTHLETSGAYPITGTWDWICLSPKKFKQPHDSVLEKAHELKVIVYNKSDFSWGEEFAGKVSKGCHLFLQPEWSKEKEVLPLIIDYVKANPRWQVSLQVHKYMDIP
jgi:organic radical activating enzyme